MFVCPAWSGPHAAHAHVLRLTCPKLGEDLEGLNKLRDAEAKSVGVDGGRDGMKLVVDVPDDVPEEGMPRLRLS